jgi:acyl-CoA synthetase (AMP-forming)/AMP-acid ligase II
VRLDGLFSEIDRLAAVRPARAAFVDREGRLVMTRGQLAAAIDRRANALAATGLRAGQLVAFGVRPNADGIAWLLGCVRAGLGVVVMDPGIGAERLIARCRVAGVSAVLVDGPTRLLSATRASRALGRRLGVDLPDPRRLAPRVIATTDVARVGGALVREPLGHERLTRKPPTREPASPAPDGRGSVPEDGPALVVFTSGTTAAPRGVVHTPASLVASVRQVLDHAALDEDSRVLGSAANFIVPTLVAGGVVVAGPRRAADLAATTRAAGVTHLVLPPHRAVPWAESGGAGAALRRLFLGSAPVRAAALRLILPRVPSPAQVWAVYGLTELLLVSALPGEERLAHDERDGDLVGRPLPGVRVRIAADGEVLVAGPAMADRYLGERPIAEVATGDIGRLVDGRLVLLGRRKEMLIRDGENVYPSLYEPALVQRAGLADAALVGVPDGLGDERAVVWVVPDRRDRRDTAVARTWELIEARDGPFDAHARPDVVLAIDALPRAGRSGKVDRRALVRLAAQRLGLPEPVDPMLPAAT